MSFKLHGEPVPDKPKPPKSPGRTPGSASIAPARIEDCPTVLDSEQASNVLRMSVRRVRGFVASGELHRLGYSKQDLLFWDQEVLRFLAEQSGWRPPDAEGGAT